MRIYQKYAFAALYLSFCAGPIQADSIQNCPVSHGYSDVFTRIIDARAVSGGASSDLRKVEKAMRAGKTGTLAGVCIEAHSTIANTYSSTSQEAKEYISILNRAGLANGVKIYTKGYGNSQPTTNPGFDHRVIIHYVYKCSPMKQVKSGKKASTKLIGTKATGNIFLDLNGKAVDFAGRFVDNDSIFSETGVNYKCTAPYSGLKRNRMVAGATLNKPKKAKPIKVTKVTEKIAPKASEDEGGGGLAMAGKITGGIVAAGLLTWGGLELYKFLNKGKGGSIPNGATGTTE